jgi:diguanylate cyclase (GGDEF)-like protein
VQDDIMDKMNSTELMANIGSIITSSLKFNEILEGIMMEIHLYFKPRNWSLLRYERTTNSLFFVIAEGIRYSDVEDIRLRKGEGIAGTVVKTGQSIFVSDTSRDDRFSDRVDRVTGFTTNSIIAVPIMTKGTIFGVIEIVNRENEKPFTEEDHVILKTIADFSAIAFENNLIYNEAINQSEIDSLTGLYNQAKLEKVIEDYSNPELQHRREKDHYNHIITIYIDLDLFKEINDRFGHAEGDEVLRRVSMRLRSLFRSDDLVFRLGGDEFLVIINIDAENDIDSVTQRIENILSSIKITSVKKGYTIGLSYGIVNGPQGTITDQIKMADHAMYENKNTKREQSDS